MNVRELVQAIKDTRPEAPKDILEVATCDFCGKEFAIQPQDMGRILKIRGRLCCWSQSCRKVLRKAQNQESKLVNPEAT
jgi:hypothetical protein